MKKTPLQHDITTKLSSAFLVSITIIAVVLLITQIIIYQRQNNRLSQHFWSDYSTAFARSARFATIIGSKPDAQRIVSNFSHNKSIMQSSIEANQIGILGNITKNQVSDCPVPRAQTKATVIEFDQYWCFIEPIKAKDTSSILGHTTLLIKKNEFVQFHQTTLKLIVVCGLLSALLTFILVKYFADKITQPLSELLSVIKKTEHGKKGLRLHFSSPSDLLPIKEAFNSMLEASESHQREMRTKVDERTEELALALNTANASLQYKKQLMAITSHELKTPIHGLQGFFEAIENELYDRQIPSNDVLHHFCHRGLERVTTLNQTIINNLDYAQLKSGKAQLRVSSFPLRNLIQQIVDIFRPSLDRNQNRITIIGEPITLTTDRTKVHQVINNLVSNAAKFTHQGEVTIEWWSDNHSSLHLTVKDTGIGIDQTHWNKLFQGYWQGDMSLSRRYGGSGLGLAIVKLALKLLDGKIKIESSVGQGTAFFVQFPLEVNHSDHRGKESASSE